MAHSVTSFVIFLLVNPSPVSPILFRTPLTEYPEAVCTDGSPAAYYRTLVENYKELSEYKNYVIFLEGGGYCPSVPDCHLRCAIANHLCSSNEALMKDNNGILSDDRDINPSLHDYYKVDLPYCTGDMYIGDRPGSFDTDGLHFVGRRVFDAMIQSLKELTLIGSADNVVLSGSSAGGAGVVFNCQHLQQILSGVKVWCVVDAAFFYPVTRPFHNASTCQTINQVLSLGAELWGAPQLAMFDHQNWWNQLPSKQQIFISSSRYDLFGFESFCGDYDDEHDRNIWSEGLLEMTQRFLTERPNAGLFSSVCRYHMVLHSSALFNRLEAGESRSTYAQALGRWISAGTPSSFQIWDSCRHEGYCGAACDADGRPDTLLMTQNHTLP